MTTLSEGGGALEGVRVVDLTATQAGAEAAMHLGDLGAEVLRITPPGPDPLAADPGHLVWNRNKSLACVDLGTGEGLREVRRLAGRSDVVVVDGRPGEAERVGLDATTLRAEHPELVHLWLPPYAVEGRWSQLHADPILLAAVTGASWRDHPIAASVAAAAHEQAALGATAATAGLVRRTRSGSGGAYVVSGLHAIGALWILSAVDSNAVAKMTDLSVPHYHVYQGSDGESFALAALKMEFFLTALAALDQLEVMVLPGVEGEFTNILRSEVGRGVIAHLEAFFATRPAAHWLAILEAADVPCATVDSREGWWDHEAVAATGMRLELDHPDLGPVSLPGVPISLSATPATVRHLPSERQRVDTSSWWREAGTAVPTGVATGSPAEAEAEAPLAGVRVLGLGTFVSGTFGPEVLGILGADVTKVESPAGDPYRYMTLSFLAANQGTRGVVVDLKRDEGREALAALVRRTDVVVANPRPSATARLGLDDASLRALNPELITCSVTAWGTGNSLAETPAFDLLVQARSGFLRNIAGAGIVHDVGTGTLSALGVVAALFHRARTGRGQEVVTSMVRQSLTFQAAELTRYDGRPEPIEGGPDFLGPDAFHRLYPTADGWLAVAAHGSATSALAELAGEPDGDAPGDAPGDDGGRAPADGALAVRLAELFATATTDEWVDRLLAVAVEAVPVRPFPSVFTDPWMTRNRLLHTVFDPDIGECVALRTCIDGNPSPVLAFRGPTPGLGQHSREVLAEAGVASARVEELVASGGVVAPPAVGATEPASPV